MEVDHGSHITPAFRNPSSELGTHPAIAAAIAVHAAALLMLLMPMAAPPIAAPVKPKTVIEWSKRNRSSPNRLAGS